MKGRGISRWPRQITTRQEHEEQDIVHSDSYAALFLEDAAHPDIFTPC
jgi:hypothetical protein